LKLFIISFFDSVASDVDSGNIAGLGTTEPASADKNAVEQTGREQPMEEPVVVSVTEDAKEDSAEDKAGARTPTRGEQQEHLPRAASRRKGTRSRPPSC